MSVRTFKTLLFSRFWSGDCHSRHGAHDGRRRRRLGAADAQSRSHLAPQAAASTYAAAQSAGEFAAHTAANAAAAAATSRRRHRRRPQRRCSRRPSPISCARRCRESGRQSCDRQPRRYRWPRRRSASSVLLHSRSRRRPSIRSERPSPTARRRRLSSRGEARQPTTQATRATRRQQPPFPPTKKFPTTRAATTTTSVDGAAACRRSAPARKRSDRVSCRSLSPRAIVVFKGGAACLQSSICRNTSGFAYRRVRSFSRCRRSSPAARLLPPTKISRIEARRSASAISIFPRN